MCGIAGFFSEKPLAAETAFALSQALLWYATERGPQSAGVWSAENGLLKRAIHPHDFVFSSEFEQYFKKPSRLMLLHTRMPTCGERTDAQAQPFTQSHVATVHNGWYVNAGTLKERFKLLKSSGVDSELLTDYIAEYGVKALPTFLEAASGSSAIAIAEHNRLYLIRDKNPLCYARLTLRDGNRIVVFASTPLILRSAMASLWFLPLDFEIFSLPEGALFEVSPRRLIKRGQIDRVIVDFPKSNHESEDSDFWQDYFDFETMKGGGLNEDTE